MCELKNITSGLCDTMQAQTSQNIITDFDRACCRECHDWNGWKFFSYYSKFGVIFSEWCIVIQMMGDAVCFIYHHSVWLRFEDNIDLD